MENVHETCACISVIIGSITLEVYNIHGLYSYTHTVINCDHTAHCAVLSNMLCFLLNTHSQMNKPVCVSITFS